MNLKIILSATLLVLIVINLIMYGYLVYTLRSVTAAKTGVEMVSEHQMLFYAQLVTLLLSFINGGLVVYKA